MKTKVLLLMLIVSMIMCVSCYHSYYQSNTHNVPLFEEKDDFRLSINMNQGVEAQGAYAVTDDIAFAVNGVMTSPSQYFDIAGGIYRPIGSDYIFETYVGVGAYNQSHSYNTTEYSQNLRLFIPVNLGTSRIRAVRSYIQPSIGVTSEYFDIAISPRFTSFYVYDVVNNINVDKDPGNYAERESDAVNSMINHQYYFFFDPAFTIRGGWKYLKVQAQYSYNMPIGLCKFEYEQSNFSIGLHFSYSQYYFDKTNSAY